MMGIHLPTVTPAAGMGLQLNYQPFHCISCSSPERLLNPVTDHSLECWHLCLRFSLPAPVSLAIPSRRGNGSNMPHLRDGNIRGGQCSTLPLGSYLAQRNMIRATT